MARIPTDELERLKSEVSVERLVEAAGVELKRAGKDLLGRCPFHEDAQASLVVTPAKNLWHCFACQIGGGPIDWMMKAKGVSFRHAVELLREGAIELPSARHGRIRVLPPPVSLDVDDQALLAQAIDYYHERLKQTPEALAYLARRGIADEAMIQRFQIGFADRTLGLRLPEKNRKAGAEIRGRLQKLGLWRESGHEHFNGSIVIPIIAPSGEITEVYGRKINDNLREGTPMHLYLPGPHRGVWNELAFDVHKEIILCEALIDALTFWCAGYRNVTASYGVEGFTADHLSAFKRYGVERVLIAYDRDEAGDRAAEKLSKRLLSEGLDCYRIQFPKGMDANEYALKVRPAGKSLGLVIRKAQWLGQGAAKPISTLAPMALPEPVSSSPAPTMTPAICVSMPEASAAKPIPSEPTTAPNAAAQVLDSSPLEALPASPVPALPAAEADAKVRDEEIVMVLGDRRYRVRGLKKNLAFDVLLRVNVMVSRSEGCAPQGACTPQGAFHVDTLDLYSVRARGAFITQAASELAVKDDVIRHDLGALLRKLEELQEHTVAETLAPQVAVAIAPEEQQEALALLKDPQLLDHILGDFTRCGVIGEETNKLIAYLAATSRKLNAPLAVMVQSSSAAGKSSLMEAVLAFMPEEDRVQYSAMTGQSLYYMGAMDLKHKILALAEEEGAARASYALKLLQSEGVLSIASTGKDAESGKLVTHAYRVEGPVMIFSTTTAIDHDEELLNRCLTLAVDESREQTRAIHQLQREKRTLAGLFAAQGKARLLKQHQNAQRLLRPLAVRNPYADKLTFPDERTRLRRDHEKYLTLIDTLALLHQHQRVLRTAEQDGQRIEYVEVMREDIEVANKLAHEALGRSLDELSPQTRRLLDLVSAMVAERCTQLAIERHDYRFSRRDVREHAGWSDFQVKMHMHKLEELEYVLVHRGGRGQSFVYELLYDGGGQDGKPYLVGLIDAASLRAYDGNKEHPKAQLEHPSSPQVDRKEPPGSEQKSSPNGSNPATSRIVPRKNGQLASLEEGSLIASYPLAAVAV